MPYQVYTNYFDLALVLWGEPGLAQLHEPSDETGDLFTESVYCMSPSTRLNNSLAQFGAIGATQSFLDLEEGSERLHRERYSG